MLERLEGYETRRQASRLEPSVSPRSGSTECVSSSQCQISKAAATRPNALQRSSETTGALDAKRLSRNELIELHRTDRNRSIRRRNAHPPLRQHAWWSQTGSNRRPHACKARALPTELWPRAGNRQSGESAADRTRAVRHLPTADSADCPIMVGLGGLEPPTSRLSSARSNQLSYKPELSSARKRTRPASIRFMEERETKTAASRQCGL